MSKFTQQLSEAKVGTKIETSLSIEGGDQRPVTLHCTEATGNTRRFAVFHHTGVKLMDVKAEMVRGKWVPA